MAFWDPVGEPQDHWIGDLGGVIVLLTPDEAVFRPEGGLAEIPLVRRDGPRDHPECL